MNKINKKRAELWNGYSVSYMADAIKEGYRVVHDYLDAHWHPGKKNYEIIKPYITPDSVILEIGCGLGRVSRYVISDTFGQFYVADIDDRILKEAERVLGNKKSVFFKKINGVDLNIFEDNKFDLVFSFGTFFHLGIQQVYKYFTEMHRVLKLGGICILELKDLSDDDIFNDFLEKCKRSYLTFEENEYSFKYVDFAIINKFSSHIGFEIIKYTPSITMVRKPFKAVS